MNDLKKNYIHNVVDQMINHIETDFKDTAVQDYLDEMVHEYVREVSVLMNRRIDAFNRLIANNVPVDYAVTHFEKTCCLKYLNDKI